MTVMSHKLIILRHFLLSCHCYVKEFQNTAVSKTKTFAAENFAARPFASILRMMEKYTSSYTRGRK